MNEPISFRVNGWPELLKLSREDAFSYVNEMCETIKRHLEQDHGNESPRQFEEWVLVTGDRTLAESTEFNRQHRQQFYDKD